MINIKVTSRMKHEDYVALYTASPYILPRKHFLGIGTTVLLCAVLILPMPSTWRAFSGAESPLTADGEAYLAADPNDQEQGVTHESNFKVQENYDDYDIPSYLFSTGDEDDANLTASTEEDTESEGDHDTNELASSTSDSKITSTNESTTSTIAPSTNDSEQNKLAANIDNKESAATNIATTTDSESIESTIDNSATKPSDKKDIVDIKNVATTEDNKLLATNEPIAKPSDTTNTTTESDDTTSSTTPSKNVSDNLLAQEQTSEAQETQNSIEQGTIEPSTSDKDKLASANSEIKSSETTPSTTSTSTLPDNKLASNTNNNNDAITTETIVGKEATDAADKGEILATTKIEQKPVEVRPEGKWYKHIIKSGDNLSGIFTHLNLPYATLNRITKVASNRDLRLDVGDPIYFLVDEENVVKEVVKHSGKTQQVRFTRLTPDDDFKVVYESLNAHMSETALASIKEATQMPLAIEAQKAREIRAKERKAREAKLLAERQAKEEQERQAKLEAEAAKAKQAREERKALAKERRAKAAERKEALADQNAKSKEAKEIDAERALEHNVTTTRPRLIINTIASGETFAKAAQRSGLTPREIATIKRIFRKQINVNKLRKGDKFRVLFTGESTSSLISAVQIQTSNGAKFESFMNPEDRNYYGENEYTPTAGVFRRFPLSGSIQVNSQFDPQRRHPVTRRISPHNGVDFKAKIGTPVYAPADGVVSFSGYQRTAGYYIIIRHSNNYSTVYMHLSKTEVKREQKVRVGQVIARTGNTGRTTGPHLHYEIRINDHPVNPLKVDLPNSNQTNLAREQREAFANNVRVLRAELRNDRLALHRPM